MSTQQNMELSLQKYEQVIQEGLQTFIDAPTINKTKSKSSRISALRTGLFELLK